MKKKAFLQKRNLQTKIFHFHNYNKNQSDEEETQLIHLIQEMFFFLNRQKE
jgi:hypothetical protein